MSSIVVSGDTSGAVTLNAPTVAGTVTVTLPSTTGTMLTTASTTGISGSAISSGTVAEAYGGTGTTIGYNGFKNRIINGAMVISQRGTTFTQSTVNQIGLDRWDGTGTAASKFTFAQSGTGPAEFNNSTLITSLSAYSVTSGDLFIYRQRIEGYNVADLGFGTANAQTITVSFWVRSSLTGSFGGYITNGSFTRSYLFSYTISSANTWEKKTVTIAGDTSGTWLTTNGLGIEVGFSLGAGATYSSTANTWAGTFYTQPTGATSVVGTNGATWYITGVQLEKGATATSFDYRDYGRELAMCQRYFCVSAGGTQVAQGSSYTETMFQSGCGTAFTDSEGRCNIYTLPVVMRTSPTVTIIGNTLGASSQYSLYSRNGGWVAASSTSPNGRPQSIEVNVVKTSGFVGIDSFIYIGGFIASAEL